MRGCPKQRLNSRLIMVTQDYSLVIRKKSPEFNYPGVAHRPAMDPETVGFEAPFPTNVVVYDLSDGDMGGLWTEVLSGDDALRQD